MAVISEAVEICLHLNNKTYQRKVTIVNIAFQIVRTSSVDILPIERTHHVLAQLAAMFDRIFN